ncbi:MAG: DNA polymerase/3'-5' exonuclease PolX [Candidatus Omnitrophica bacterium]|nr:DNA polymerase/3'-5' exonuclease PolX [Candidatus Omnitrophota bacterium]
MNNIEIAEIFREIAQILEIKGENVFRIRAYERAAQNIESLTEDISDFIKNDSLSDIPGIGKDLSDKIKEIYITGKLKFLSDLKKTIPEGLLEILKIPSVGPKTAKLLYDKLKIKSISDLESAIKKNKLAGIFGIKEKTIENIQKGIELVKKGKERMSLAIAMDVANYFTNALSRIPEVKEISTAGSLRRKKETVRDIDILVVSNFPGKIMDVFTKLPAVKRIMAKGETKSSVLTKDDVQVDVRVVEEKEFGAALLYFTGSKNFNVKLRHIAQRNQQKINEYGVFSVKGPKEKYLAGKTEEEIFKFLKLDYIEPEMREDTGEIELASKHKLPKLIDIEDIKGDLHTHSTYSDGGNSISDMAKAAIKKGYQYIALTDHSQSLRVANGMSAADLKKKKAEIEKLNNNFKNFVILYGTEVDIDSGGNLDYKDSILEEFDIVVAAIHTGFKQSKSQITKRIVNACKNKHVDIIAHPTGRLWGTREPYDFDFDEILKVANDTGTFLEINAFPNRLDLNDVHSRAAKEKGVKLSIGTDSHLFEQLDNMRFGVAVARRGWLEKNDVVNTLNVENLLKIKK